MSDYTIKPEQELPEKAEIAGSDEVRLVGGTTGVSYKNKLTDIVNFLKGFFYTKSETYSKAETYSKEETYSKAETYAKGEVYSKDEAYSKDETYAKSETYSKEETYSIDETFSKDETYSKFIRLIDTSVSPTEVSPYDVGVAYPSRDVFTATKDGLLTMSMYYAILKNNTSTMTCKSFYEYLNDNKDVYINNVYYGKLTNLTPLVLTVKKNDVITCKYNSSSSGSLSISSVLLRFQPFVS